MCTAVSFNGANHYFGRNLDLEYDLDEKIIITPRNYKIKLLNGEEIKSHPAIIGMAIEREGYPLYFDGTNEYGLSIAGLNFPGNAKYFNPKNNKTNIASFELIPWILSLCRNVPVAKKLLHNVNITDYAFMPKMPPSPLHWIISDRDYSITLEQTKDGLKIYDNPVGVLTNNPTFDFHMTNLSNYMGLSADEAINRMSKDVDLKHISKGMGAFGLPGDLSSVSRFVKTSFTKLNSVVPETELESVNQFFHILYSVYHQKGCVREGDTYEITNYTSCCNTDKGIYYYTTYNNFAINAIDMYKVDLDGDKLTGYELIKNTEINIYN